MGLCCFVEFDVWACGVCVLVVEFVCGLVQFDE